jgi:selenocysteine lyase/cysteine desulfurase
MLSVEGLGGFYISKEVVDKVRPVTMGWGNVINAANFMDYDFTLQADAKKFEEGTPNTMSIHAFGAALELLLEVGIDNIEKRVMSLGDCVIGELKSRGIKIYSSTLLSERSGNISFALDKDVGRLYSFMLENKVKLTVRDGLVRFSPHFYNNEEEILKVFDLLDSYLKK